MSDTKSILPDEPKKAPGALEIATAVGLSFALMVLGLQRIGWPPVIIVGGSSIVGLVMWLRTWRHGPIAPELVLPPFLLTVAALEAHMFEEYWTGFGPAMSRLFGISWSGNSFLVIFAFAGPVVYSLTALGLFWRKPLAGYVAWFIFIGPGVAELSHFVFPLLKPAVEPADIAPISKDMGHGIIIAEMRNYWIGATGRYYFPGLYTAVLPMVPGIAGIRRILRTARQARVEIEAGWGPAANPS